MPPGVNNAVIASAGAIAVSVAVAAAIAIYESPELRRNIDELRRRIALALHSLGEGIDAPERYPMGVPSGSPMFNRPEDAQGFYESRDGAAAEPGVDADEETRRRQREELMYWNAVRLEKEKSAGEKKEDQKPTAVKRGSSFDDFLRHDEQGEKGSFVYNTGADARSGQEGLVHRRGPTAAVYANPFADEHQIDRDELSDSAAPLAASATASGDAMSDIYSATTRDVEETQHDQATTPMAQSVNLVDLSQDNQSEISPTLDGEPDSDEYMTAGQDDRASDDAYASIQAWAQGSSTNFYSPLPLSPAAPMSEPELISEGMLTPTDSVSVIGSGEDVGHDASSSKAGDNDRPYDVLSESEGMLTPASWSEVGSVISENDVPAPAHLAS